jgi:Neprosin
MRHLSKSVFAGAAATMLAIGLAAQPATAQPFSFVTFDAYLSTVARTHYASQASEQMRDYVLDLYQGVKAEHSYQFDGAYFDCVGIMSQPSVRELGLTKLATPPAATAMGKDSTADGAASPLRLGLVDAFGNAVACGAGTIPMRRLSLDQMTRFPSLQAYLAKSPDGVALEGRSVQANPHRYAARRQHLTNFGGNSWINLWNPSGEFTLSQQWFATGANATTQSVEGGWVHYPGKFGNNAVLFIFSTPDGYAHGCYNLECSGFVQTNNNWHLGGAWSAYSTPGGAQWGFQQQWKYFNGNWWLFLKGSGTLDAVGYYPGSVFNGGEMSRNASRTTFGGETFTSGTNWPQMGSGAFPGGYGVAAFHNSVFYLPRNESGGTGVWSDLNVNIVTNPNCYRLTYHGSTTAGGDWPGTTYFYYGGPGGNC